MRRDKELSIETAIAAINNMPDLVAEYRIGISLPQKPSPDPEGFKLIQLVRESYRAKATWLRYQWLSDTGVLPDLRLTNKARYYCSTIPTRATLKLAEEVCLRVEHEESTLAPLLWTVLIEAERCEKILTSPGGYCGTPGNPSHFGKEKFYSQIRETTGKALDLKNWVTSQQPKIVGYREALESEAVLLAKEDSRFRPIWEEYLKATRKYGREVRRSELSVVFLDTDGVFQVQRRGKKRKLKAE